MEIIFIGFAVILGLYLLLNLAGILLGIFTEYVLPILVYCGIGSFFFWLVFWIFGIKEFFGISTIIIGAILGFIVWILVTFFNNNGGFGNYEHEDMDHDMPTHVKIDKYSYQLKILYTKLKTIKLIAAIETRYCSINSHNRYCIYNVIEIK